MADIELIVKIPEEAYKLLKNEGVDWLGAEHILNAVANGTRLPKGHGKLYDENEILRFLKCPKYENCNESQCINLNNINSLQAVIEADKLKEMKDEKK